jgi:hypothetical protein
MLTEINPVVLPALRIAGTFFLIFNIIGGVYIFLNRHRFFDQDPNLSRGYRSCSETKSRGRPHTLVHPNSGYSHFAHLSLDTTGDCLAAWRHFQLASQ